MNFFLQSTAKLIEAQDSSIPITFRGEVEVKGKGRMVSMISFLPDNASVCMRNFSLRTLFFSLLANCIQLMLVHFAKYSSV